MDAVNESKTVNRTNRAMTTNKALRVLGVFLSFFVILFGFHSLIPQVISDTGTRLTDTGSMIIHASGVTYYITFVSDKSFAVMDTMISAGLTFL
jgi:hypothetical protein